MFHNTRWAIAARLAPSLLEDIRCQIADHFQTWSAKVVAGSDGISVLLVFRGSLAEGEALAARLSREHATPAYLLDFSEEHPSIREFNGPRCTEWEGQPADFLEAHGVIAPLDEPRPAPEPPVIAVGVVDGITLVQARRALPRVTGMFTSNSRGVLVDDIPGLATVALAMRVQRRSYTLFYDRTDGTFMCTIWSPNRLDECYAVGKPTTGYRPVRSIEGETTLDGILRVLDIPRRLLFPAELDDTGDAWPPWGN